MLEEGGGLLLEEGGGLLLEEGGGLLSVWEVSVIEDGGCISHVWKEFWEVSTINLETILYIYTYLHTCNMYIYDIHSPLHLVLTDNMGQQEARPQLLCVQILG